MTIPDHAKAILRITNHFARDRNGGIPYDDVDLIVPGYPAPWQLIDQRDRERLSRDGMNEFTIQFGTSQPMTMVEIIEGLRELERLRAALPKTADGVTVVPGMNLYGPAEVSGTIHYWVIMGAESCSGFLNKVSGLYSTREAAERAGKS